MAYRGSKTHHWFCGGKSCIFVLYFWLERPPPYFCVKAKKVCWLNTYPKICHSVFRGFWVQVQTLLILCFLYGFSDRFKCAGFNDKAFVVCFVLSAQARKHSAVVKEDIFVSFSLLGSQYNEECFFVGCFIQYLDTIRGIWQTVQEKGVFRFKVKQIFPKIVPIWNRLVERWGVINGRF